MYIGRFRNGTVKPMIFIEPEKSALAPAPAIARPQMSMTEFFDAAHTIEPTSNRHNANRKVLLTLK